MRLLNTSTFLLEEFIGSNLPKYAILSHRWEREEVTFQDLQNTPNGEDVKKEGWPKIKGCCKQGISDKFDWVWIDSCCIDKSSSAELSEAINSMFDWYREAQVCYTYLSDVPSTSDWEHHHMEGSAFRRSQWFTRGWTLQELLAPKSLVFFSRDWARIATRANLAPLISDITGIQDLEDFEKATVAQKMSWAAKRETTRIEDSAYSLMGLFGVNMPPLYGEGRKAFIRLQLEIARMSDDESIFAWRDAQDLSGGLFARSPAAFELSGAIQCIQVDQIRPPYTMTNQGLYIESHLLESVDPSSLTTDTKDTFLVPLQCMDQGSLQRIAVRLRWVHGNQYARICSGELVLLSSDQQELLSSKGRSSKFRPTTFYVKQRGDSDPPFQGPYKFLIPTDNLFRDGFKVSERYTSKHRSRWESQTSIRELLTVDRLSQSGIVAAIMFTSSNRFSSDRFALTTDRFVLVLDIQEHSVGAKVVVPQDQSSLAVTANKAFKNVKRAGDVTSRIVDFQILKSGKRVELSLLPHEHYSGYKSYEAAITLRTLK